jgi:DNA mismatch endonuclease (patch repair protein)
MADVVDKQTRSRMMSGIRGRNTKPELVVRRHLHRAGMRFSLRSKLPGRPDIVLPKYNSVVFVHGCFWHRHEGCRYCTMPSTNVEFWTLKFDQNVARDARAVEQLRQLGWRVFIVWSCELQPEKLEALVAKIRDVPTC